MHVCVFCMKYETSDFLANPLICLKQCRHNGNCPHIFPLKVTKGREGGTGDRKTHALSAVTYMPCSQAATYTHSHHSAGRSVIFILLLTAGHLPARALPPKYSGLRMCGGEGHGRACACAGAYSEHIEIQACPDMFCWLPLLD